MSRILALAIFMFTVLAICTSCMDEEPAEISVQTSQGGNPVNIDVQLFNDRGVQIQDLDTDRGFVIIKALKPGTYFLKFKDKKGAMYPAIRKVTIGGGDSHVEVVDVDDVTKNAADFPTPPA
ncbi:MAG: T9SS type A sorting domain-containing protein [bacterium]|nr:T9SS type A sorting domain-containing protein [bacterium]